MFLFLAGCSLQWFEGGQSGNEDLLLPLACEESARAGVAIDAVAEGFAFAPSAVVDATSGAWEGWFDPMDGDSPSEARLAIDYTGLTTELVQSVLVGTIEDSDGEFVDVREASAECPPRYELRPTAEFSANGGAFDEALTLLLSATPESVSHARLTGEIALADVRGAARPAADPTAWRTTSLALFAQVIEAGTLNGTLTWESSGPVDDSTSGSSVIENAGGFSLTPSP